MILRAIADATSQITALFTTGHGYYWVINRLHYMTKEKDGETCCMLGRPQFPWPRGEKQNNSCKSRLLDN